VRVEGLLQRWDCACLVRDMMSGGAEKLSVQRRGRRYARREAQPGWGDEAP
jgi:hypothetical protein